MLIRIQCWKFYQNTLVHWHYRMLKVKFRSTIYFLIRPLVAIKFGLWKKWKKMQIYFWGPFQTLLKAEILEAIGFLLGRGVNAFHKDNFGSTPLDWLNSYCQLTDDVKEAVQEKFQEGTVFFILKTNLIYIYSIENSSKESNKAFTRKHRCKFTKQSWSQGRH